jgi:hypothetical protein
MNENYSKIIIFFAKFNIKIIYKFLKKNLKIVLCHIDTDFFNLTSKIVTIILYVTDFTQFLFRHVICLFKFVKFFRLNNLVNQKSHEY